jgi:hypothetical protein
LREERSLVGVRMTAILLPAATRLSSEWGEGSLLASEALAALDARLNGLD